MRKLSKILVLALVLVTLLTAVASMGFTTSAATTRTIYFKPSSNWLEAGAWFDAWTWGGTSSDAWVTFTDSNYDGIYEATIPSDRTGMKILRKDPASTAHGWTSWAETGDLTITSSKNCLSNTGWSTTMTWSSIADPSTDVTFTVAGAAGLAGTEWDNTNAANDMTLVSGRVYEKTFTGVAAGTYEYKVLANHAWTYSWGSGSSNASVTVELDNSDVTITFNEETKAITAKVTHVHTGGAATCTSKAVCTVCEEEYGDFASHTEEVDAAVAATCTSTGLTEGKHCSVCNEVLVAQTVTEKIAHNYVNGACSVCGHTCLIHNWSNGVCSTCQLVCEHAEYNGIGQCQTCGMTCSHDWDSGECTICGKICVMHSWVDGVCAICGIACEHEFNQTGGCGICRMPCPHEWVDADCDTPKTCSVCLKTEGSALGHVDNNANHVCDRSGCDVRVSECVDNDKNHACDYAACRAKLSECADNDNDHYCDYEGCDEKLSNCTPAAEVRENVVEATCKEAGSYVSVINCSVCGVNISSTNETIAKLPHTEEVDAAVAATCTSTGLTEGKHCSVCNEVLLAQTVTDTIAHDYVEGSCSVCGAKDPDYVAPVDITLSVPGGVAQVEMGADNVLPEAGAPDGYEFAGWSEITIEETTEVPEILEAGSKYTGSAAVLYAVYTRSETTPGSAIFEKVTANRDDWSGTYLIVYEAGNVAFNGGLATLDAVSNTVAVTITDGKISVTDALRAATFTIDAAGNTILSASGNYIGVSSYANGLKQSTSSSTYTNTISISNGNVLITSSAGPVMKFNKAVDQMRFRYYKSGQQDVQLYRLNETVGSTTTYYLTMSTVDCDHNYESVVTEPTCTDAGYTTHTCSKCGDSYTDNNVAATGHSHVESITTEATCTTAGLKTFTCSCGDSYTEEIAALGHDFVDGVCSRCGEEKPANVMYYLQATVDGITYYWDGSVSSGKGGITTDVNNAVQLTVETDGVNTYIYYTDGSGNKNYLYFTDGNTGFKTQTSAKTIKYDSATGYVYEDSFAETRYASTYGIQDIRSYKASNIKGTNVYMIMTPIQSSTNPECTHENTETTTETVAPTCTEAGKVIVKCECGATISTTEGEPALGHIDENNDYKCDRDGCTTIVPPAADSILTIEQALALGALYTKDNYTENKYYITGTIVDITSTTYGNMNIEDENGNKILVYGVYSADGSVRYDAMETKPVAGDTITVYGIIGYYTAPQMKNGYMTEHIPAECDHVDANGDYICDNDGCGVVVPPEADTTLTYEEATQLGLLTTTTGKYYMTGIVTEIVNTQYGNLYIKDENGNTFYIYGLYSADGGTRYDAMEQAPAVGDTITVYGIITSYNGSAQMKNGWVTAHTVHTHEYSSEITTPSTCLTSGTMTYTCACGHTYTEEIPTGDHNFVDHVCSVCGKDDPDHYFVMTIPEALAAADGKQVQVSGTVCAINTAWSENESCMSVTIIDAEGNELYIYKLSTQIALGDIITVKGKMTTYNEKRQIAAGSTATIDGHDGSYDYKEMTIPEAIASPDNTNVIVVGTVVAINTEYSEQYGNISVTIADADGNRLYIYRLSGNVNLHDIIEVKGVMGTHDGNRQITGGTFTLLDTEECSEFTDATCEEAAKCVLCGKVNGEALGHNIVVDEEVAPTCTTKGLTEGSHCTRCNDKTVPQEEIDMVPHTEEIIPAVAPTCTATGLTEGKKCSVCGEILDAQEEVAKLEHTAGEATRENNVAPTCTATGSYDEVVKCSVCGEELSRNTITVDKIAHSEEIIPAVAPTCTETGLTEGKKCSVCGEILDAQEEVAKLGHNYESVVTEPTFDAEGYTTYTCSECGDSYKSDYVDALVAVAMADGVKYTSFAEALANGSEIVLLADIALDAPVVITGTVVIDLNGFTLSYESTVMGEAMIKNTGNLTINDSVGGGVINYNYVGAADSTYSKGNYTISNSGTLTVNGGKITIANLRAHAKYPIDNNSTSGDAILVINGGHLYNYNTSAIRMFCNSTTYKNSVTINGGLIEGYSAIWMQNPSSTATVKGDLTITDGEIRTTAAAYVNGTADLKDVSSKIYTTSEGGAWSEESFINFAGGIFNENVNVYYSAPSNVTVSEEAVFNGNIEYVIPHVHDYTAVVTAPTCTTEGFTTYTCDCGDEYTDNVVAALDHDMIVDEAVAPTCTETGLTEGSHCSRCDYKVEQQVVAALDHDMIIDAAKAPTCTETGLTEGSHCSRCDYKVEQQVVAANGHRYGNLNVISATCTENGYIIIECGDCGGSWDSRYDQEAKDYLVDYPFFNLDKLGHDMIVDEAVAPTCTETGLTEGSHCSRCDYKVEQQIVPANGHTDVDGDYICDICEADLCLDHVASEAVVENIIDATCTKAGSYDKVVYCSQCHEELSRDTITVDKIAHTAGEAIKENIVDATCTATGSYDEVVKCTVCGEELSRDTITVDKLAHSEEIIPAVAPTCTATGLTEGKKCSVCGEILDAPENVAKLEHTAGEATRENNVAPTCTATGSYDEVVKCTVCGEELSRDTITVDKLAHTAGEATRENVVDATCTATGSYDEVVKCTVCGEELSRNTITVDKIAHSEEIIPAVAPTCTETGLTEGKKCSVCGEILDAPEEVAKLEHTAGEATRENVVDATCTATGSYDEVVKCSVCGEELSRDTITVDKIAHSEEIIPAVAPTCTATGLTEGKKCSVCGTVTVPQEEVAKLAHTAGEATKENVVDATCTKAGSYDEVVKCSVCGEELSRDTITVDLLGHDITAIPAKAPTCTEAGYTEGERCTRCDYKTGMTVLVPLGHASETVVENVVEATCTEPGSYVSIVKCATCDKEFSRNTVTVDALGHDIVVDEAKAPTCLETGLTAGEHCTRCDHVVEQTEVPATGHSYEAVVTDPTCTATGFTTYTCECGDYYIKDVVDALGHNFVNGKCERCEAQDPSVAPQPPVEDGKDDEAEDEGPNVWVRLWEVLVKIFNWFVDFCKKSLIGA